MSPPAGETGAMLDGGHGEAIMRAFLILAMLGLAACGDKSPEDTGGTGGDGGATADGGASDGGASDGGSDTGATDGGSSDGGADTGATDGGSSDGGSDTGGSDTGASDALAAGVYGGEHFELTVNADGSGFLEGDCGHATLDGPLVAPDGTLELHFDWVSEAGPSSDTGTAPSSPATVTAGVAGGVVDGVFFLDASPSATTDFHVELGVAATLYKCA